MTATSPSPTWLDVHLRVAAEADSFEWHGKRPALASDCRRYNPRRIFMTAARARRRGRPRKSSRSAQTTGSAYRATDEDQVALAKQGQDQRRGEAEIQQLVSADEPVLTREPRVNPRMHAGERAPLSATPNRGLIDLWRTESGARSHEHM